MRRKLPPDLRRKRRGKNSSPREPGNYRPARDSEIVGGFADSLESYPAEVWRRYIYDQLMVAAEIGASPVVLQPEVQELLYHGVVRARKQSGN